MQALNRLRPAWRHLRQTKRFGAFADRAEERLRDIALSVNRQRIAALRGELQSCRGSDDIFAFAESRLGIAQKKSEILGFTAYAAHFPHRVICEVGTMWGGTHFILSHALDCVEATIAVDLVVRNRAKLTALAKPGQRLTAIQGCSYAVSTRERVARALDGRKIDLLFIDGDHRYHGVKADFLGYREFVREGGLIAFHDVCGEEYARSGCATSHYAGDVPGFWRKIRTVFDHAEFVESMTQDGFGIGVIVHRANTALPADL